MNREELQDTILDLRRSLAYYQGVKTACDRCERFSNGACRIHGPVPDEFAHKENECVEWIFDGCPF